MTCVSPYIPPKKTGVYLDPRTKCVLMSVLTTLLFFENQDILFVSVLSLIPAILLITNGQFRTVIIYGSLFILAIIAKLTRDVFYLNQVLNGINVLLVSLVMRLFPTFMLGYYLIKSTTVGEFVSTMQRMHISMKIIIPISVVFRFVPTIREESRSIGYAMRMREISVGSKQFWKNPGTLLEYRLIPLMMSIVKIGDELSSAALTKGLGFKEERSSIARVGFCFWDALIFLVCVLMTVWVMLYEIL